MAVSISLDDVQVFVPNVEPAKAEALTLAALARAAMVAPCILDDDFPYEAAAKGIIVEAIIRRLETGAGSLSLQQAGPFQQAIDTRTSPRVLFWPAEITELQALCNAAVDDSGAALPTGFFGDRCRVGRAPAAEHPLP